MNQQKSEDNGICSVTITAECALGNATADEANGRRIAGCEFYNDKKPLLPENKGFKSFQIALRFSPAAATSAPLKSGRKAQESGRPAPAYSRGQAANHTSSAGNNRDETSRSRPQLS
jgi:hypothetical protein